VICDDCGDTILDGDAVWVCTGCDATYCDPCALDLGEASPECRECSLALEEQTNA